MVETHSGCDRGQTRVKHVMEWSDPLSAIIPSFTIGLGWKFDKLCALIFSTNWPFGIWLFFATWSVNFIGKLCSRQS